MHAPAQRSFACPSCQKSIFIPHDLPPTTAACPHCAVMVTSPPLQGTMASPAPVLTPAKSTLPLPPADLHSEIESAEKSKSPLLLSFVLLMLVMFGGIYYYTRFIDVPTPIISADPSIAVLEKPSPLPSLYEWKNQARETLTAFFQATTVEEKARYVIGGRATVDRLYASWGDILFQEAPLSAEDFAPIFTGNESDQDPVYLLMYERPAQYDIKNFFRPLVKMEVMQGAESLDPLTRSLAEPANFLSDALKVQVYLKPQEDGMRLDYDIYLQTRYRTLRSFAEQAPVNAAGNFRVVMLEDVPLPNEKKQQLRVYRVTDPVHISDSYRAITARQSVVSERISPIHWYGNPEKRAHFAAATLRLRKLADGSLMVEELICWDFDGLGGSPGNELPRRAQRIPTEGNTNEAGLQEFNQ